jgi:hypothetical protein
MKRAPAVSLPNMDIEKKRIGEIQSNIQRKTPLEKFLKCSHSKGEKWIGARGDIKI